MTQSEKSIEASNKIKGLETLLAMRVTEEESWVYQAMMRLKESDRDPFTAWAPPPKNVGTRTYKNYRDLPYSSGGKKKGVGV